MDFGTEDIRDDRSTHDRTSKELKMIGMDYLAAGLLVVAFYIWSASKILGIMDKERKIVKGKLDDMDSKLDQLLSRSR